MDGGLAMWSESLKIRLSMTAVWLTLAACLLIAARFMTPAAASVVPADAQREPVGVPVAEQPITLAAEHAG